MRTVNYTCDRCGRPMPQPVRLNGVHVETGLWETKDYDENPKRVLNAKLELSLLATDGDRPELCRVCVADVLIALAQDLLGLEMRKFLYKVQVFKGEENGVERWEDMPRDLAVARSGHIVHPELVPIAEFETREEAAAFIALVREGREATDFRDYRITTTHGEPVAA